MKAKLNKKLLIIGKIPPPIGGVTIHVSRLLQKLENTSIHYDFLPLSQKEFFRFNSKIRQYSCIHLHTSNPYVRLYIALLCRVNGVKSIVTIHGDIGRFNYLKNLADKISIKLSTCTITLNDNSYIIAKKLNKNAVKLSAFIPPNMEDEYISSNHIEKIQTMKQKYQMVFCTNAYNKTFDKNGHEIYGIEELISSFSKFHQFGLVFSDPSGVYSESFAKENIELPSNIFIIKGAHSFYRVINLTDAHIRNTSTDGDSLSVKESLYLNKPTLVTDIVSRPPNSFLFHRGEFEHVLQDISKGRINILPENHLNYGEMDGSIELIKLYEKMI